MGTGSDSSGASKPLGSRCCSFLLPPASELPLLHSHHPSYVQMAKTQQVIQLRKQEMKDPMGASRSCCSLTAPMAHHELIGDGLQLPQGGPQKLLSVMAGAVKGLEDSLGIFVTVLSDSSRLENATNAIASTATALLGDATAYGVDGPPLQEQVLSSSAAVSELVEHGISEQGVSGLVSVLLTPAPPVGESVRIHPAVELACRQLHHLEATQVPCCIECIECMAWWRVVTIGAFGMSLMNSCSLRYHHLLGRWPPRHFNTVPVLCERSTTELRLAG